MKSMVDITMTVGGMAEAMAAGVCAVAAAVGGEDTMPLGGRG